MNIFVCVQLREAAEFREVKLKGKNHILKSGHYRLKNELKQDIKQKEQLQEQVIYHHIGLPALILELLKFLCAYKACIVPLAAVGICLYWQAAEVGQGKGVFLVCVKAVGNWVLFNTMPWHLLRCVDRDAVLD